MENAVVINFGELWLKGKNRDMFINKLYNNIKLSLNGIKYNKFEIWRDRLVIFTDDTDGIIDKLKFVFGISKYMRCRLIPNDMDKILDESSKIVDLEYAYRVIAHRSYKNLPFKSYDIVTAFIKQDKIKVSKDSPHELHVNPTKYGCFIYTDEDVFNGIRGLPVGVSGKCIVLLSGGIDSPLAAYYAMKRGLQPIYLHLHGFNDNKLAVNSKIGKIVDILSKYSNDESKVYYVPAYMFQLEAMKADHKYEVVLLKRFIFRLAYEISKKEKAYTFVTGESLGQVSSQTVSNLITTSSDIKGRLIFRPLIGFDKIEIIDEARRIGTYDYSIESYRDVCSMHSKDSATKTFVKKIEGIENEIDLEDILDRSLLKSEVVEKRCKEEVN